MLNMVRYGETGSDEPPLLIAHGLYGSARNWNVIAKGLSKERHVVAVDMRNHGTSPRAETQSYADMAVDLAEVIASLGGRADVLGHSMGGKASMVLALKHPGCVRKLIVADIAPVAYSHSQIQYADAMMKTDLSGIESRRDGDAALKPLVPDASTRAFLLQSLDVANRAWRLNLPVLAREMDKIVGFPDISGQFDGPTMFLSGGLSDYVSPAHREKIKAFFPTAVMVKLPGAGHWLHAEKPRDFEVSVAAFLKRQA